jgi:hypothetical protein
LQHQPDEWRSAPRLPQLLVHETLNTRQQLNRLELALLDLQETQLRKLAIFSVAFS